MKLDDLSKRVAELADAKTKAEIRESLKPPSKLLNSSYSEELVKFFHDTSEEYRADGGTQMGWNWFFERVEELMFKNLQECGRRRYITEFLEKIERLDAEVSEIKSELENQ